MTAKMIVPYLDIYMKTFQNEEELIELDGERAGTKKYIFGNQIFWKRGRSCSNTETYECSYVNHDIWPCKVKIKRGSNRKLLLDLGVHGRHSHKSDKDVLGIEKMIKELKDAAHYPGLPQLIYDRIVPRNLGSAKSISLQKAAGIIDRERKRNWIKSASSFTDLAIKLKEHHTYKEYFQDILESADGSAGDIIIFGHNDMIKRLNNAEALYLDGNFKVAPQEPSESMQVWNILMDEHGSKQTETHFVAFALCTNANQGTYFSILDFLKKKAPGLEANLKTIYTDFEQAAILAYKMCFPRVKIQGCWFHYSQAITKKWEELRLNVTTKKKSIPSPQEILYVSRNLPLLPKNEIKQGLAYVSTLIDEHIQNWPQLEKFRKYLIQQWLNKAELLSSFASITRTNNKSEAFNRSLNKRMEGPRPRLGTFLYNLYNIITTEMVKSNNDGHRFRRQTNQQEKNEKNIQISNAQAKFREKELTVKDFLYEVMTKDTQNLIMEKYIEYMELQEKEKLEQEKREKNIQLLKKRKKIKSVPEIYEPEYGDHQQTKKKKKL